MHFRKDRWWENEVIYQIYPLTFADGNGDGIGDLRGIIQRIDYLNDGNPDSKTSLGIDAIWISPINKSPMIDNGYDISNYYDICPTFGTLEDFEELLAQAHQRQIKIIMDLVINHTSNLHEWFIESSSSRDNDKSDWYLWQDPLPGRSLPNNWLSYFGGTGWTFHSQRQQYYYHSFNKNQPDLNWQNPQVRESVYQVIKFWLDKGVDGFRLDASSVYSKDKYFRDNPNKFDSTDKNDYHNQYQIYNKDLPENHQIIKEIREIADSYDNRCLIGETFIDSQLFNSILFYGINNDEFHLPLTFEFAFSPWYPGYIQREIQKKEAVTPPGAIPAYFLNNHDLPRHLSRWVECSLCSNPLQIAKAAATILLTVRGTPLLYYGEEIGMVNHLNIPPEKSKDVAIDGYGDDSLITVRDGTRTPMQWDDSPQAGFSFGKDVEPWLPVNDNYPYVNAEAQLADEDSIWNFYRALLRVRKNSLALSSGSWKTLIHFPYEHLAYVREKEDEKVLVIINFSEEKPFTIDEKIEHSNWKVLLSNCQETGKVRDLPELLEPFEISILQKLS